MVTNIHMGTKTETPTAMPIDSVTERWDSHPITIIRGSAIDLRSIATTPIGTTTIRRPATIPHHDTMQRQSGDTGRDIRQDIFDKALILNYNGID